MQPTPRAVSLRAPLAEAMRLLAGTLQPESYDPATDSVTFRIAASDYETSLFAPRLLAGSGKQASFIFHNLVRQAAVEALHAGDIDLLIGYTWHKDKGCDAVTLFHEDYRVVARENHPAVNGSLDLARYTRCGHVLVSPGASLSGIVDKALAGAGASRRVVASVPYFLTALATVAGTDLLATVPTRLARAHATDMKLQSFSPPVPIRSFPVQMVWSRRLGGHPALTWLRAHILALAGDLAGDLDGTAPQ